MDFADRGELVRPVLPRMEEGRHLRHDHLLLMRLPVRLACALASVALVAASCAANDAETTPAGRDLTFAEWHTLREDAIALCMAENGFEYTPLVYLEGSNNWSVNNLLQVTQPEESGYFATLGTVLEALTPTAAPPPEWDEQTTLAYVEALTGSQDSSDGSGCRETVLSDLPPEPDSNSPIDRNDQDQLERVGEFFDRLLASDEYALYVGSWGACMQSSGVDAGDDPLAFVDQYYEEIQNELDPIILSLGFDEEMGSQLGFVGAVDSERLLELARNEPGLSSVLDREIATAVADAGCREASWDTAVEAKADQLSEELLGLPYSQS